MLFTFLWCVSSLRSLVQCTRILHNAWDIDIDPENSQGDEIKFRREEKVAKAN